MLFYFHNFKIYIQTTFIDKYLSEPSNAQNLDIPRTHSQKCSCYATQRSRGNLGQNKKLSIVSGQTQRSFCLSHLLMDNLISHNLEAVISLGKRSKFLLTT